MSLYHRMSSSIRWILKQRDTVFYTNRLDGVDLVFVSHLL